MAEIQTKRYPIRGALYGLVLGLSAWYFLQIQFAVFGLDTLGGAITRAVIVVVAGILVGVLWAFVAPARKPRDDRPVAAPAPPAAAPADEPAAPALPSEDE